MQVRLVSLAELLPRNSEVLSDVVAAKTELAFLPVEQLKRNTRATAANHTRHSGYSRIRGNEAGKYRLEGNKKGPHVRQGDHVSKMLYCLVFYCRDFRLRVSRVGFNNQQGIGAVALPARLFDTAFQLTCQRHPFRFREIRR